MDEFFKQHKAFSTSQAKSAGIDKQALKRNRDIVELGTFQLRSRSGKPALETVYTFNPELARLVKQAQKFAKKGKELSPEAKVIIEQIESIIRTTLGWENKEGETNE